MWWFLTVFLAACWPTSGFLLPGQHRTTPAPPRPCSLERPHGMLGAECRERNLVAVPTYLKTDIVVLSLAYNRIRELYNTSFVLYPYLRFLYLEDNSISYIESGTFDPINDLEVLNLNMNSLHAIPDALQSLPYLKRLYLGKNPFGSVIFLDPLPSIEVLDVSECRLRELPSLEAFPRLLSLNVSGNRIKSLNIRQIAPLCRLIELDVRANKNLFRRDGFCDCIVFGNWTNSRKMRITPSPEALCAHYPETLDSSVCFNNETALIFEESLQALRSCETQVLEYGSGPIRLRGSVLWTLGAAVAVLVLIICVSSVYFAKRRRRHQPELDTSEEGLTAPKKS